MGWTAKLNRWLVPTGIAWAILLPGGSLLAADLAETTTLLRSGDYEKCIEQTSEALQAERYGEQWPLLKIAAEMRLGRYADAKKTLTDALIQDPSSMRLRWFGYEVLLHNNLANEATQLLTEIEPLVRANPWKFRDIHNQVAIGEYLLEIGGDPKEVLAGIFDPLRKRYPKSPESYLAAARLALSKHDYALAATNYQNALRLDEDNANAYYGLGRALFPSDGDKATEAIQEALKRNPRHIDSLLFLVERHLDAEKYDLADVTLRQIAKTNPRIPALWAYRATLAHLRNEPKLEQEYRDKALAPYRNNPMVDYLIGKKLARRYRFDEAATYQRRALTIDAGFLPAKMELSNDLLRLGNDEEGWQLATEVKQADSYNVVAHNLVRLQQHMSAFKTIQGDGLAIRMDAREAEIYGQSILELLGRARAELTKKYDMQLDEPTYVEIFPEQQDFAIRTFGLPGGAGFLGVCFGRVITANSPASQQASPHNWQAVLWHEYAHVVTLQKTKNKMPRWLSEGISVYEELQANPSWGQSLNAQNREMILGTDGEPSALTPVSELSSAFMQPKSGNHLMFAYFQSSMVVEYIVDKYGFDTLKRILVDLGVGMPINESLARYAGSIEQLDKDFAAYAHKKASEFAPDVDWSRPDLSRAADADGIISWLEDHPGNLAAYKRLANTQIKEMDWGSAKETIRELHELYPNDTSNDCALRLLAEVFRQQGQADAERRTLTELAKLDPDALDVYQRLIELAADAGDQQDILDNAQRYLAVNPLNGDIYLALAEALTASDRTEQAVRAFQAHLELAPIDPAAVHLQLAKLWQKQGDLEQAKRHVLVALEEAPRFRAAHTELLKILRETDKVVGETDDPQDFDL